MITPLIANLGPTELILIVLVIVLLFGASKLPELARGSGRALRIFKAETKGLMDDDDEPRTASTPETRTQAQLELEAKQRDLAARQAELDAEAEKLRRGETA
jgi:sec-independent protein translocase protein TatA